MEGEDEREMLWNFLFETNESNRSEHRPWVCYPEFLVRKWQLCPDLTFTLLRQLYVYSWPLFTVSISSFFSPCVTPLFTPSHWPLVWVKRQTHILCISSRLWSTMLFWSLYFCENERTWHNFFTKIFSVFKSSICPIFQLFVFIDSSFCQTSLSLDCTPILLLKIPSLLQ